MLFDLVLFFVSITLLFLTSTLVVTLINIKEKFSMILAWFVLSWAQIVIGIELLSIFKMVRQDAIFFWHLLLFLFVFSYIRLKKISLPKLSAKKIIYETKDFACKKPERIYVLFILFIFITTVFISIITPSNNWDSMTYHMSRAAYWYQHGTIDHFFTNNLRQNVNPVVAEIGILWTFLFAREDLFANLIQWTSLVFSSVALYAVCRKFGFEQQTSLLTTLTFLSLPMVILQASTSQNDLITAAFIMIAVYFTFIGLNNDKLNLPHLFLAGLSLGLAVGTKGYALFFLPGFFIFSLLTISRSKELKRTNKSFMYIGCCLLGILLFSTYNWVQNFASYGNLLSDGDSTEYAKVVDPNITTLISNIIRYWISFFDLPISYFQDVLYNFVDLIHSIIGIGISSERTTIGKFDVAQIILSQDSAYFGPLGFFLIWPGIIAAILVLIFKYFKKEKIDSKLSHVIAILGLSISFFLVFSFLLKWQPWGGRLLVAFVLTSMPAVALLYSNLEQYPKINKFFMKLIIISIITTSFLCLFLNYTSPVIPIGFEKKAFSINNIEISPAKPLILKERTILTMNRTQKRFFNYPEGYLTFELVNQKIPADGKLGLVIGSDDWDYPFFGEHFGRRIFQISKDNLNIKGFNVLMNEMDLDGILVRKSIYLDNNPGYEGEKYYERGDFRLITK
ncbi:MAG: hypothetical protein FIB08_03360 [Candidatus Methanoperedens sp.]|nr:hypothetical protein [Candidatus Methanoperedens sp.]